jgi:FkbM family methyltransferase
MRTARHLPWLGDCTRALEDGVQELLRRPRSAALRILAAYHPRREEHFIDVGAGGGQSARAIRLIHPRASIVCFEPSVRSCSRLRRRMRGDDRTRVHRCVLGAEEGRRILFTPWRYGRALDELASTAVEETRAGLDALLPARTHLREEIVTVRRLDDFSLRPCLIRLDVEGAALDVLRGAERTIRAHSPLIVADLTDKDHLSDFLKRLDPSYGAYSFDGARLSSGLLVGKHVFFVPQSRERQLMIELVDRPARAPELVSIRDEMLEVALPAAASAPLALPPARKEARVPLPSLAAPIVLPPTGDEMLRALPSAPAVTPLVLPTRDRPLETSTSAAAPTPLIEVPPSVPALPPPTEDEAIRLGDAAPRLRILARRRESATD